MISHMRCSQGGKDMCCLEMHWGLSTWCGHSMKILGFGKEARNVPLGFPEVVPRISFEIPAEGGLERKEA